MNFLQQVIHNHLPSKAKKTPSGWISINCPMCQYRGEPTPDTRQRGGFALDGAGKVGYHCFRCGYATKWEEGSALPKRLIRLLQEIGFSMEEIRRLQFEAMRRRRIVVPPEQQTHEQVKFQIPNFKEKSLPEKAKTIEEWAEASQPPKYFINTINYLYERGQYIFEGWQYYYSPKPDYQLNKRIIIPFYHAGKVVGWTARYAGEPPKNVPKYFSEQPNNYLFNSAALYKENRQFVIIVEGVLDAIALDCLGTLGNTLNETQIGWINTSNKDKIVLPDFAPGRETLATYAMENDWYCSFPDWDSDIKDVAQAVKRYGKLYTLKSILDGAMSNKVKIGMNIKRYTKKRR